MASNSPTNSEPVLINHSTADITSDSGNAANTEQDPTDNEPRPPPLSRASTSALEKCWICLSSKDEDPPSPPNPTTPWRHPCSCTLQAHESCLLDWIADQEAPRSRSGGGRSGPSPDKILCPQCRSEIKVQRPNDALVNICRRLDRQYSRLVLPGLAAAFTSTLVAGCWAHGHTAVYMVFGQRDATRLYMYALPRPGHNLAYALIPINLIFARTRFADFILPSGTLFLLGTQLQDGLRIDWTMWPPLPSTVFACLPALSQFYNWAYEKAFGKLNKKWIEAVRPRREEGYEGQEGNIADILNEREAELAEANEGGDGGMVLELELNIGAVEEDDGDIRPLEEGQDVLNGAEGVAAAAQAQAQQNNANGGGGGGGGHVHRLLGDNELMDDTSSIGQTVIGALFIPAVASVTGEVLKMALPNSWTSPSRNFMNGRFGLLSTKWGRSVVGGCLFVVVKDMLTLYCRWRLAEGHKTRRVMNFNKKEKVYERVSD